MNSGNPIHWTDPSTWPWIVYVWLAMLALGWVKPLWRWFQRNRASSWPTATGQIESVSVNEPKRFSRAPAYVAELGYSYAVAGSVNAGFYKREFGTEGEAWEFARDLKGKPISVQYNPNKSSTSTLSEPSIETLLQARAPKPAGELFASTLTNSAPYGFRPFLWVFIGLSVVGLLLSLWVHLGAVMGRRIAPEAFFWIFHVGIFVVWFPAVFVAKQRVGSVNRKDFWRVVLAGSPEWMRYMVYGFFGYAMVNFALFAFQAPTGGSGANPPAIVWRGFSGHWMAFYSAALAILYSAASDNSDRRRCVNGHPVSRSAAQCELCGQPVM